MVSKRVSALYRDPRYPFQVLFSFVEHDDHHASGGTRHCESAMDAHLRRLDMADEYELTDEIFDHWNDEVPGARLVSLDEVAETAGLPKAAFILVRAWDTWQQYLEDAGIKVETRGCAPFYQALTDLRAKVAPFDKEQAAE